jgi:hypothetical protein
MKMRMIAAMLLTTAISIGINNSAKAQPGYRGGYHGNGNHYGWRNKAACGPRVVYTPRRVYRRPICAAPVYAAPVYAPPVCAPAPAYYAPARPYGPRVQFSIGAAW